MPDVPSPSVRRCGACAYFHSVRLDPAKGVNVGECSYGTWPPVRPETSCCPAFVPVGELAARGPVKLKRAVQGRMRPDRPDEDDADYNEKLAARAPRAPRATSSAGGGGGGGGSYEQRREAPAAPRAPVEIEVDMDEATFRSVLREILADELGVGDAPIGDRWKGGEIVLKPGREGTQEKRMPIEAFFHKIVMVRDKLRVLEQKINGSKQLSDEDKVTLQQYITGVYGSLTTFNMLFKDEDDRFVGASEKD